MGKEKRKKEKSRFVIRLEYIFFLMLFKTLELLPLSWAMPLGSCLMKLLFYLDRRHARRTIGHIMYSGVETDPRKAAVLARANFGEFGKLLVEIAKIKKEFSIEKVRRCGSERAWKFFIEGYNGKKQFILASAHYGNWEVAGTIMADILNGKIASLMRGFSNPLIGDRILANRGNHNHELVDKTKGLRPILQALSQGKTVSMVVDQHAASAEGVEVAFFGHPSRHHRTPALLHLKSGIPIIPTIIRRRSDKFEFDCVLGEPIIFTPTDDKEKDIALVTQLVSRSIEDIIRQEPVQWLWTPRHWLSIDRKCAADYADWKPRFSCSEIENILKEQEK
jgi:KDO2-lipid IV(A) lauroyltransferase